MHHLLREYPNTLPASSVPPHAKCSRIDRWPYLPSRSSCPGRWHRDFCLTKAARIGYCAKYTTITQVATTLLSMESTMWACAISIFSDDTVPLCDALRLHAIYKVQPNRSALTPTTASCRFGEEEASSQSKPNSVVFRRATRRNTLTPCTWRSFACFAYPRRRALSPSIAIFSPCQLTA